MLFFESICRPFWTGSSYMELGYMLDQYDPKFKEKDADIYALFDTFGTTKDSLKGYLVVPPCDEDGYLYVQRSGDKLNKSLWKLEAGLEKAMFSKGVTARLEGYGDTLEGTPSSLKKIKSAYAYMWFDVDHDNLKTEALPKKSSLPVDYGFLGYQSTDGWAEACGFGTVKVVESRGSQSIDFCGSTVEPGEYLIALNSASGCLGGWFNYVLICDYVPIFDLCTFEGDIDEAPICGTWSIKLNEKMSGDDLDAIETAIKSKMKNGGLRGLWN